MSDLHALLAQWKTIGLIAAGLVIIASTAATAVLGSPFGVLDWRHYSGAYSYERTPEPTRTVPGGVTTPAPTRTPVPVTSTAVKTSSPTRTATVTRTTTPTRTATVTKTTTPTRTATAIKTASPTRTATAARTSTPVACHSRGRIFLLILSIKTRLGAEEGERRYLRALDLNRDGVIDRADITIAEKLPKCGR